MWRSGDRFQAARRLACRWSAASQEQHTYGPRGEPLRLCSKEIGFRILVLVSQACLCFGNRASCAATPCKSCKTMSRSCNFTLGRPVRQRLRLLQTSACSFSLLLALLVAYRPLALSAPALISAGPCRSTVKTHKERSICPTGAERCIGAQVLARSGTLHSAVTTTHPSGRRAHAGETVDTSAQP